MKVAKVLRESLLFPSDTIFIESIPHSKLNPMEHWARSEDFFGLCVNRERSISSSTVSIRYLYCTSFFQNNIALANFWSQIFFFGIYLEMYSMTHSKQTNSFARSKKSKRQSGGELNSPFPKCFKEGRWKWTFAIPSNIRIGHLKMLKQLSS